MLSAEWNSRMRESVEKLKRALGLGWSRLPSHAGTGTDEDDDEDVRETRTLMGEKEPRDGMAALVLPSTAPLQQPRPVPRLAPPVPPVRPAPQLIDAGDSLIQL